MASNLSLVTLYLHILLLKLRTSIIHAVAMCIVAENAPPSTIFNATHCHAYTAVRRDQRSQSGSRTRPETWLLYHVCSCEQASVSAFQRATDTVLCALH